MPENFGARLRQRREQQQISLSSIADQTKIAMPLLEALERDDVSQWPGGIFRRAFIRAYAAAIGLEPDVVVREFLEAHPDPVEVIATPPSSRGLLARILPAVRNRLAPKDAPVAGSTQEAASDTVRAVADTDAFMPPSTEVPARAEEPVPERRLEDTASPAAQPTPLAAPPPQPDLLAVGQLCTELGRVEDSSEAAPLLKEAVRLLDAAGLIVWVWDPQQRELRPALAYGYSDKVLAQLPSVGREADNATAAAFRAGRACVVNGNDLTSGALAVPLISSGGSVGVLAIELQHGKEQGDATRAIATILAAQLARWIGAAAPGEVPESRTDEGAEQNAVPPRIIYAS